MSTFWTVWVIALVLIALGTMYYVIGRLYQNRKSADYETVVAEYDGVEDRDGPVPNILWLAYAVGLGLTIIYFLYMPALGAFHGLGGFQAPTNSPALPLDELRVAEDRRERLVELVRGRAGELGDQLPAPDDPALAAGLGKLADYFVMDAFGTALDQAELIYEK